MPTISETVEKHHQSIIVALLLIIVVFLVACTFHDVVPICHYVFGCDHKFHVAASI